MTSSPPAEFYLPLTTRALANLTAVTGCIIKNPKLKIVNGQMLVSLGSDIHPYPEDSADPMMDVSQVLVPLPSLHPPTFLASPPFSPLSPLLCCTSRRAAASREKEGEGGRGRGRERERERERVRFGIFLDAHAFSRISCAWKTQPQPRVRHKWVPHQPSSPSVYLSIYLYHLLLIHAAHLFRSAHDSRTRRRATPTS
jgi:hypothetical protein